MRLDAKQYASLSLHYRQKFSQIIFVTVEQSQRKTRISAGATVH